MSSRSLNDLFDTHCHVHELLAPVTGVYDKWLSDGTSRSAQDVIEAARVAGVSRLLCIGTTLVDSELAVECAGSNDGLWAAIGIHPHEAKAHCQSLPTNPEILPRSLPKEQPSYAGGREVLPGVMERFEELAGRPEVVAVGECGLDYFYGHSPKAEQELVLRFQLELALRQGLPLSLHVRSGSGASGDAYVDFWRILADYPGVRGVLHSFTDSAVNLERAVQAGLYLGVNGICTFAKAESQLVIYRTIPQHLLVLETDAPFLTPVPFRGKVCEPGHIVLTARHLAALRGEDVSELVRAATANARKLFNV